MKHIAAYLLLQLGGNESPSAEDIKGVLGSVGIDADEDRLNHLLSELKGKDINELIAEGSAKLATVSTNTGPGPQKESNAVENTVDEEQPEDDGNESDSDGSAFGDLFG